MAEPIPMIEGKIQRLTNDIAAARTKALSAASINSKGIVKVDPNSPELVKISEMEQAIARLAAIQAEIGQLFQTSGVETREELHRLRADREGDIHGAPLECFKFFKMYHELPKVNGGHPDLLPSDLVKAEAYQKVEREQRARMDRATADLEKINPVMARLHALISEANSL